MNKRVGATKTRYSFPYFYDPNFEARLSSKVSLMSPAWQARARAAEADVSGNRWDGQDPTKFEGTYGTCKTDSLRRLRYTPTPYHSSYYSLSLFLLWPPLAER